MVHIEGLALKLDPKEMKRKMREDVISSILELPRLCSPAASHSFYLKEIGQHIKIGRYM